VIWSKSVFQAMVQCAIPALDCVWECKDLPATPDRAFSLLCNFIIIWRVTFSINMHFPRNVWVFVMV
jgi:hypothetical protein